MTVFSRRRPLGGSASPSLASRRSKVSAGGPTISHWSRTGVACACVYLTLIERAAVIDAAIQGSTVVDAAILQADIGIPAARCGGSIPASFDSVLSLPRASSQGRASSSHPARLSSTPASWVSDAGGGSSEVLIPPAKPGSGSFVKPQP